jgi:hypothetical protein
MVKDKVRPLNKDRGMLKQIIGKINKLGNTYIAYKF